jgi:hypothetical protein
MATVVKMVTAVMPGAVGSARAGRHGHGEHADRRNRRRPRKPSWTPALHAFPIGAARPALKDPAKEP